MDKHYQASPAWRGENALCDFSDLSYLNRLRSESLISHLVGKISFLDRTMVVIICMFLC